MVLSFLNTFHFGHDLLDSKPMHELHGLGGQFGVFLGRLGLADMDLNIEELAHHSGNFLLSRTRLTTGTSKSYKSRHFLASGLTMSTSLKAKGCLSQTSDRTDLAWVHRPQPVRVKKVILQDWRSLRLIRMTAIATLKQ
jgi:hypothetical protein